LDYESTGNGYIEVARDAKGEVSKLYHLPVGDVRWGKEKQRVMQQVGEKKVWFKLFGDERILDKNTGKFVDAISKPEDVANEVIPIVQYTHKSSCYGLPEWLPAIYHMFGDFKETEYNIDFFLNFGIPAYAVIVEGKNLSQEVKEEISKYFETTLKGTGSQHKTLTLNVPTGGSIKFEKLNVEQKEASFRVYHKDNRDSVLTAHHVPPYRVGIVEKGQLGGSVATETDRIYLDSVINPRQTDFSWVITEFIIKEGFQVKGWELNFKDINIYDEDRESQIAERYIGNGIKTPNEIRKEKGLDPYDGGDIFYMKSALVPIGAELEENKPDTEISGTEREASNQEYDDNEGTSEE
jgi:PBSX family phage portal protein